VNIDALINAMMPKEKKLEAAFIAVFSAVILIIFYTVISMNGVVLGNDPAVHLEKAQIFLRTGEISLANIGWTPPLYQILLAMLISLSGAGDIGQYIFWVKALVVVFDWLLFMSVYLLASRFFDRRVGAAAVILLLLCFPVFEANQFGGYTTVLALAFMVLVLLYTPLAVEKVGYLVVAFFAAFGLVLSHQLAAFLAVFIMPPVLLFMLIKSRGKNLKVILALMLGGGIAFFLYYFQAMIGYIDIVIDYVFFAVKTYAYQIPNVSLGAFMVNFGFIFFLALGGVAVSYHLLKKQKKPLFWLILVLSLFVPFFFAESYLIGFYMPFAWFIYYMATTIAILAAVLVVFIFDKFSALYVKKRQVFRKNWVKALTVGIIIMLSVLVVLRADTVYGKIQEAGVYYATTDIKALDAGLWLKNNYPDNSTVVVTEIPGFWFQEFSGKNVTAQTELAVQRTEVAEAVLTLSYEMEHSQTMLVAYQAKGDMLDENYVSFNNVSSRVSFSSGSGDSLSYTLNGVDYEFKLSQLSKEIVFEDDTASPKITFVFSNDDIVLTKTLIAQNSNYAFNVTWTLTPLKSQIQNASLYLTTLFDLKYHFDKADIPHYLDWINPWDAPEPIKTSNGTAWAVASFAGVHLKDNYLGLYDDTDEVGFAFRFNDLPEWGNIGALPNRQIDAVRFQYQFNDINVNQTASRSYQVLTLSKNSFPTLEPDGLEGLFDYKPAKFTVTTRDYRYYIREYNIGFIVYDKNQLDTQIIHSKILQLIYSNDRYVIFKIQQ
jgi:hypothetical protein